MHAVAFCCATASAPPAPTRYASLVLFLVPHYSYIHVTLCVLLRVLLHFRYFAALRSPHLLSQVYIVPVMNPDGFAAAQRMNANGVDLNRNVLTPDFPYGACGSCLGAALHGREQGARAAVC